MHEIHERCRGIVVEEQLPFPEVAPVCFRLKQTSRPRKWFLKIVSGPWLDYLSILVVLLSCVNDGMYQPCVEVEEESFTREILGSLVFLYFIMEMLIKTIALGFIGHKGSYLSSHWNKFDLFIIFAELMDYTFRFFNLHVEASHAIKPVRLISRVPSMRILVTILLETAPMLGNVLILYAFVIHIFGVIGVQMWAGKLRNRCFLGDDILTIYNVSLSPYFVPIFGGRSSFICSPDDKGGGRFCRDVPPYQEHGKICTLAADEPIQAGQCVNWNMYYNVCRAGDHNPDLGVINFDNIGYAWITIFQVVTLEGWTNIMYYVMDSYSFWSFVFFILVTIIGSFIIMNVCAVIIATQFSENFARVTTEQHAGPLSFKTLFRKFVSFLKMMTTRVQPVKSSTHVKPTLHQVWIPFKEKFNILINTKFFNRIIIIAIFITIVTMAMEHYNQPQELTRVLIVSNIIITIIFVVEMIIKLIALSWMYFADLDNIFDFVVVLTSLWELGSKADGKLSVVRAFYVLRFVRVFHFLPYLKRQLLVLKRTIREASTLCWLMLFVIFIFSIVGMHLFGCKFHFRSIYNETADDRKNFDSLLWSMVTVFQILTQDDWNVVLYNAVAATSPWAAIYFIAIIVFGKNVLLNVLVGIGVDSFQARPSENIHQDSSRCPSLACEAESSLEEGPRTITGEYSVPATEPSRPSGSASASENPSTQTKNNSFTRFLNRIQKVLLWCQQHKDWSLYMLSPQSRLRRFCQRLMSHKVFDHVILFFILLNCVTIAMERPSINPKSMMVIKVIALGLVIGKGSYCRSFWNLMDGFLVILSSTNFIITLVTSDKKNMLSILKVFRLLRTLRTLRMIKQTPKLKLAVKALIASAKPIGNIVLICCVLFFFFGILGVQLFKGKFFYCEGENTSNITNKAECLSANYTWVRKEYNFDNFPQALIALFVMYSKDGWMNIMYDGLDAVGVDQQPVKNYNEWMLIYFISFMVMSFFLLDMYIGVMVETFHVCRQQQKQSLQRGGNSRDKSREENYFRHYSLMRRRIYDLSTSRFLELFMTVVVFINVVLMASEHYNQPLYVDQMIEYSFYVFTVLLVLEIMLKVVAFGVLRFIKNSWNMLDIAIVLVSFIVIIFTKMNMEHRLPINPSILSVTRVLRLAQVLKAKKIRVLLRTITKTLSQVGNLCLLFMFFFFIYAALGVELFGNLECTPDYPCEGINQYANFKNFGMALLTLYKVCTGDNWSGILKDTLRPCRPNDKACPSYLWWASPICFATFVVLVHFVLANLVVAAVVQALEESKEKRPKTESSDIMQQPQESPGEPVISSSAGTTEGVHL
ncbi:voltage-dependent T-type calcium channel subunit alpha-1H-like isoform X2 [Astatotilapia calliptera]|uniref:voltage-dependent T-type calcium channel subunit alpha-1H-like isoform X2 n=1 Tax=Astatotilapia calliptera TaxID=8154 RepID=UPI000E40020A|nr:voltage-dependent T-type calcium channel subunit alpha-1H-like isoform X2 [Astatotilapia calliptera]